MIVLNKPVRAFIYGKHYIFKKFDIAQAPTGNSVVYWLTIWDEKDRQKKTFVLDSVQMSEMFNSILTIVEKTRL